ncbi:tail fiber protein [Gallibacterium sp. AGMB14963]|uniref:tail fiber protein n=1 Tax=Gallibacterium faecale TaxID=3019086 RepID=UPI0022F1485A|nr:tail fiber protein [Gallibacterium sp. AGMB14963]MDA3979469.1 tail fiber protein [Gallibacterium sp. AGMB14963]
MADYKKPTVDSNYINFVDELHQAINATATWNDGNNQNIPIGAKRWNDTSKIFEKYTGAKWVALSSRYNLPVYWGSIINKPVFDSSVTSTSTKTFATPKAVKTANDNANTRVSKSGDTMSGNLIINAGDYSKLVLANSSNQFMLLEVNPADSRSIGNIILRQGDINYSESNIIVINIPRKNGEIAFKEDTVSKSGDTMSGNLIINAGDYSSVSLKNSSNYKLMLEVNSHSATSMGNIIYRLDGAASNTAMIGLPKKTGTMLLKEDFNSSIGGVAGYTRLPNGLLMQWVQANSNIRESNKLAFPIPFSRIILAVNSQTCGGADNFDLDLFYNNTHVWGRYQTSLKVIAIGE